VTAAHVVVAGAGIVGLAHALMAARAGHRVTVFDRDPRPIGASIRNFGFITVTGQPAGDTWRRARRSRDIWAEIADPAGIPVRQQGLLVLAHSGLAAQVLEAFRETEMGAQCALLTRADTVQRCPEAARDHLHSALFSPHELRVEPRHAIPRLIQHLRAEWGVTFRFGEAVRQATPSQVETPHGAVAADAVILCPGADFRSLRPDLIAPLALQACRLHMLRIMPDRPVCLPHAVMADLSLVRYGGYAALPEAAALRARLDHEAREELAHGIHLIVVQNGDGSLTVGDSHHYDSVAEPFADERVDDLILRQLHDTLSIGPARVVERWQGVYPSGAADRVFLMPEPGLALVMVTSGTGMSTAFAIAEETMAALFP